MTPANLPFLTQVSNSLETERGDQREAAAPWGGRATDHWTAQVLLSIHWSVSMCPSSLHLPIVTCVPGRQSGRRETGPSWRSSSPRGIRSYVDTTFHPAAAMWTGSVRQVECGKCGVWTEIDLATVRIGECGQRVSCKRNQTFKMSKN